MISVDDPTIYFEKACSIRGPFVYGFLDLFSGSGESWQFSLAMEDSRHIESTLDGHRHGYGTPEKTMGHDVMPSVQVTKPGPQHNLSGKTALRAATAKLEILDEKSEEESSTDTFSDQPEESDGNATSSEVNACHHSLFKICFVFIQILWSKVKLLVKIWTKSEVIWKCQ